jgi:hypothetical protein
MLCGTEVGQLIHGSFRPDPGCDLPLPRRAGMARCYRCGGSLYLDPIDSYQAPVAVQQLRAMVGREPARVGSA